MKKFTIAVAFMLLCGYSYAQQVSHAYNPDSQAGAGAGNSKTPGLTDLVENKDDMTGITMYYDPRTSPHSLRGSGMFALIVKRQDQQYVLKLVAYHVLQLKFGQTVPTQINVTGVLIKTTDTLFAFENPALIHGNGSNMTDISIMGNTMTKDNYVYKILSRVIAGDYCKLRFESTPQIDDYELSNREIKEIKTVVNAWLAVNNIQ